MTTQSIARCSHLHQDRKTERRVIRWLLAMTTAFALYVGGSVAFAVEDPPGPVYGPVLPPPGPIIIIPGVIISVIPMSGGNWSTPGSGNNRPGWSW